MSITQGKQREKIDAAVAGDIVIAAKLKNTQTGAPLASGADFMPLTPAGSDGGPTMMKSLCMTSFRFTPLPSSMNFFSAAGECTSRTSASPFEPMAIAWPEPTAMVFTK